MKLIAKKMLVILVSFFLATNAYGYGTAAALREIFTRGPQTLSRLTGVSTKEIAALTARQRVSLYRTEMAKYSNRDILEFASSSDGANIEDIGEALVLAVLMGNVPLYRAEMIKLLDVPLSEFNYTKQKAIFSEEILTMMYRHPIKSVRHQFRRELYDLLNHLHRVESSENRPSPLFELPEEHVSLFEGRIPELELETTPLGRAIMEDNPREFIRVYKDLLQDGSLKTLLAQIYAKSYSGEDLHLFTMKHMYPSHLTFLKNALESDPMLTLRLKETINKFNYKESSIPRYAAVSGSILVGATPLVTITPTGTTVFAMLSLSIVGAITGAIVGKAQTERVLHMIRRAR